MSDSYRWMTFHLMQFRQPYSAEGHSFSGPTGAGLWRVGPDSEIGPNGLRTRVSDTWAALAFYADEGPAHAVIDDPAQHLPYLVGTIRSWHALLCPITHRGNTNWFSGDEKLPSLVPSPIDPGGRLMVFTTAGFDPLPPEELMADLPRRKDFIRNVQAVRELFAVAPGNIACGVFQTEPMSLDGCTFSLWASDAVMAQNAYQPGHHRAQVDRYRTEKTVDRTSWTRARPIRTSGAWDGI